MASTDSAGRLKFNIYNKNTETNHSTALFISGVAPAQHIIRRSSVEGMNAQFEPRAVIYLTSGLSVCWLLCLVRLFVGHYVSYGRKPLVNVAAVALLSCISCRLLMTWHTKNLRLH